MDRFYDRLAADLLGPAAVRPAGGGGFGPDAATALEIAFGQVRSELTYLLELARANGLPAAGAVTGDDVWLRLGAEATRFTLDRRALAIAAEVPGRAPERLAWSDERRGIVDAAGNAADARALAREALSRIVAAWKAGATPTPTPTPTSTSTPTSASTSTSTSTSTPTSTPLDEAMPHPPAGGSERP